MFPGIRPGARLEARATVLNQSCGVREGAMGRIVFTDSREVSIYLERGIPGAPWIEAVVEPEVMGRNFRLFENDIAPGYVGRGHYQKRYPDDFRA
jgi:hypothetical protein